VLSILGLADDLTGALEIGALFHAPVSLVPRILPGLDRQVIDTETRHLTPGEAAERAFTLVNRARASMIYKKTDSTLRGNIRAEFEALLRAFPASRITFVPAYPAMGRTVRNGLLYVNGVPIAETEFAEDPLNPVTSSEVPGCPGVTVLDAETDPEIEAAARTLLEKDPPILAAGPGALARAIAVLKGLSGKVQAAYTIRRALIVNGSVNEASARQVRYAEEQRALPPGWKVFTDFQSGAAGMERAFELGRHVEKAIRDMDVDALIIFGGDTAFGIMTALGIETMDSPRELLPGVPISHVKASGRTLQVITKAGGFGGPNFLRRLLDVVQ
jgi:uncharacterized protein YgbK (DUF1537 family)